MRISVVIPVLSESENIRALAPRLRETLEPLTRDFEVLFVDDGSTDDSAAAVAALHSEDARFKLVSFSRNFGYAVALTAGLDFAEGDAVITMDGDFQHPPALLPDLVRRWREGYEVVHTVRVATDGAAPLKGAASALFYPFYRWLTGTKGFRNAADFRLLDRKAVLALRACRERARFVRGLSFWVGFRSCFVEFSAPARRHGDTKFSWDRMLRFAADGIFSFSARPLYLSLYVGLLSFTAGMLYAGYALWAKFVAHAVVPGWTSTIIVVSVLGGLQMLFMGVQGFYLARIFEEVKQRPLYLVRSTLGIDGAASGPRQVSADTP
jgi:dolichol-phosphate mannosyltransferase